MSQSDEARKEQQKALAAIQFQQEIAEIEKRYTEVEKSYGTLLTREMLSQIEVLAGRGLNQQQISCYLGFGEKWLNNIAQRRPIIKMAYKRGKAKAISMVTNELIRQIKNGSTNATIFYLKTQAGWRYDNDEKDEFDVDGETIDTYIDDNVDANTASQMYQDFIKKEF